MSDFYQLAEDASIAMRQAENALEDASRIAQEAATQAKPNDVAKRIWEQRVQILRRAALDVRQERRKYS